MEDSIMTALSADVREVITSSRVAHLVTLGPEGRPQVSCVWVGLDDGEIVAASLGKWAKVKNVLRDPRVSLSIETDRPNPIGLIDYLVVHGQARVQEGGAPALLAELARVYLGPDATFAPLADSPPPGYVIRITVDRIGGVGPWAGHAGEGAHVQKETSAGAPARH
jgi:PPOX class probable F420-dependent enzyme